MSWGLFGQDSATIHVAPADELGRMVAGHVPSSLCPCRPSVVTLRSRGMESRIYSHIEPDWPGALPIDRLPNRVPVGGPRPEPPPS